MSCLKSVYKSPNKPLLKGWKAALFSVVLTLNVAWAETPVEAVQDGTQALFKVLKTQKSTLKKQPGKVFEIAENVIVPRFDFGLMAQWVMGRPWRQASAEQKLAFTKEFKELMINTYASALLEYSDQEIKVIDQPNVKAGDTEATVKTQVVSEKRQPVAINFVLHEVDGKWLVFDVSIEGVSVVTNYRASIAEEIKTKGMDGMIAEIAKKNISARQGIK